jgi:hypothetical protein
VDVLLGGSGLVGGVSVHQCQALKPMDFVVCLWRVVLGFELRALQML